MYGKITTWIQDNQLPAGVNLHASLSTTGASNDPHSEIVFRSFVLELYRFAGHSRIRKLDIGSATDRPNPLSKADLALECSTNRSASGNLLFWCSLQSPYAEGGSGRGLTLAVSSWTDDHKDGQSLFWDLERVLRLGSDNIEIAWTLGEAQYSHTQIEDMKHSLVGYQAYSSNSASEWAKACPHLGSKAMEEALARLNNDYAGLTRHLSRMGAGLLFVELEELLPKVIRFAGVQTSMGGLLEGPREVADAYRAGKVFAALELHWETHIFQQRSEAVFRGCPPVRDTLSLDLARRRIDEADEASASLLKGLLDDYGITIKLPPLQDTDVSQRAFNRYVRETRQAALKAMRVKYAERLGKTKN